MVRAWSSASARARRTAADDEPSALTRAARFALSHETQSQYLIEIMPPTPWERSSGRLRLCEMYPRKSGSASVRPPPPRRRVVETCTDAQSRVDTPISVVQMNRVKSQTRVPILNVDHTTVNCKLALAADNSKREQSRGSKLHSSKKKKSTSSELQSVDHHLEFCFDG